VAETDLHGDLTRLADGDRQAFDPVYVAAWPLVSRFARRVLGDSPDAEDAAQMALIKVFERAHTYDPARPPQPWILGLTWHECRTVQRRRAREATRLAGPGTLERLTDGQDPERTSFVEKGSTR
jgi:RNA polymerase sigma-70 factor (ECF subfamily)